MSVGRDGVFDYRPDAVLKLLTLGDTGVGKRTKCLIYRSNVIYFKS